MSKQNRREPISTAPTTVAATNNSEATQTATTPVAHGSRGGELNMLSPTWREDKWAASIAKDKATPKDFFNLFGFHRRDA